MKKIALALALLLLPASAHPYPAMFHEGRFSPRGGRAEMREARLDQQKSKWAPNGMKVLFIHGKRRWVVRSSSSLVEKINAVPILKEGV